MIKNQRCILIADDEPKMVRALRDFFAQRISMFWKQETVRRHWNGSGNTIR